MASVIVGILATIGAVAQTVVPFHRKESAEAIGALKMLKLDPILEIRGEIEELKKQDTAQRAEIARLKAEVADTKASLRLINSAPKGYATTYITKVNWDNLPGTTLLKVWMRH